jgi:hypothetical protein
MTKSPDNKHAKNEEKALKKAPKFAEISIKISTFYNNFCNKKAIVNCMIS